MESEAVLDEYSDVIAFEAAGQLNNRNTNTRSKPRALKNSDSQKKSFTKSPAVASDMLLSAVSSSTTHRHFVAESASRDRHENSAELVSSSSSDSISSRGGGGTVLTQSLNVSRPAAAHPKRRQSTAALLSLGSSGDNLDDGVETLTPMQDVPKTAGLLNNFNSIVLTNEQLPGTRNDHPHKVHSGHPGWTLPNESADFNQAASEGMRRVRRWLESANNSNKSLSKNHAGLSHFAVKN